MDRAFEEWKLDHSGRRGSRGRGLEDLAISVGGGGGGRECRIGRLDRDKLRISKKEGFRCDLIKVSGRLESV